MHSSLTTTRSVAISRRTTVISRANLLKDAADGMVRIFSPPTSTLKDVQRIEGSYSGEKHHTRKTGPFKDGYSSSSKPVSPVREEVVEGGNVVEYLGQSLKALLAKNFSRSSEEPEWMNSEATGYKGPSKRGHGSSIYGSRK